MLLKQLEIVLRKIYIQKFFILKKKVELIENDDLDKLKIYLEQIHNKYSFNFDFVLKESNIQLF